MASSLNAPNATTSSLYMMETADPEQTKVIEIEGMGHITDVTEDPDTGTLWVLGLTIPRMPTQEEIHDGSVLDQSAFFKSHLARIELDESGPVKASKLSDNNQEWTLPISIVWSERGEKP